MLGMELKTNQWVRARKTFLHWSCVFPVLTHRDMIPRYTIEKDNETVSTNEGSRLYNLLASPMTAYHLAL